LKIEFVNHSGFIIDHQGCRIMCDPWLENTVFLNGWQLLSPSKHNYSDFEGIQYLWFSHEHPDHFNPSNLNRIPAGVKQNITVLFQHTIDKRVLNYCNKAGFKQIIELMPGQWLNLGKDLDILCEHFKEGDSWIAFRTAETTILNTNDCGIRNTGEINTLQKKIGKVDVLLTQFSYAYWAGNPGEVEYRKKIAAEKLEGMQFQCEHLKPKIVIPMASYVWFCHEENFYLNDSINTPRTAFEFLNHHTSAEPIILYNGESYEPGTAHNNLASINQYEHDFSTSVKWENTKKNGTVELEKLEKSAEDFLKRMHESNSFLLKSLLKPVNIYISDYKMSFVLSVKMGFLPVSIDEENADISLSSECLLFCFLYPYGSDTLQISGRFQKPAGGNFEHFHNMFRIEQLKSKGIEVNLKFLFGVLARKILIKAGVYKP
jgi:UDP-MurNAc hydroxylase